MASHKVVCAQAAFWSAAMEIALPELDREFKAEVEAERRKTAAKHRGRSGAGRAMRKRRKTAAKHRGRSGAGRAMRKRRTAEQMQ